jgi:predicted nuclease of predicted toxin-antitoxin system
MPWVEINASLIEYPPTEKEIAQVEDYHARRAKPRFYADEGFPAQAVEVLREWGARILTVQEAGKRRHPDENHLAYALKKGLVFITCDRDFLNDRRFPLIHCPTIGVFDFGSGTLREMKQAFRCLANIFNCPQFYDKWCKIDAHPTCWTEHARFLNGTTSRTRHRYRRGKVQEWTEE